MIKPVVSFIERHLSQSPKFVTWYADLYKEVVRKELVLAGVDENDTVLHIGCGGIPFTAIHIAKLTNARVIGVDKDEKAVHAARLCLEKMGLSHRVKVICLDASEQLPQDFTVAFVALQAQPKNQILQRIQQIPGERRKIVLRLADETFRSFYDKLSDRFVEEALVEQEMKTFDRSVLIRA